MLIALKITRFFEDGRLGGLFISQPLISEILNAKPAYVSYVTTSSLRLLNRVASLVLLYLGALK